MAKQLQFNEEARKSGLRDIWHDIILYIKLFQTLSLDDILFRYNYSIENSKNPEVLYAEEDCSKHTSHSHSNGYGLTIHSNPGKVSKYFVSAFLGLIYALVSYSQEF